MKKIFILLMSFCFYSASFLPSTAFAAPTVSNDYTVFYYLAEIHRQHGQSCSGAEKQKLPNLVPSEGLRAIAQALATTDKNLATLLSETGIPDAVVFTTNLIGSTPQQALENFKKMNCANLEDANFKYIGAYNQNDHWLVLLSNLEPAKQKIVSGDIVLLPTPTEQGAQNTAIEGNTAKGNDRGLSSVPLLDVRPPEEQLPAIDSERGLATKTDGAVNAIAGDMPVSGSKDNALPPNQENPTPSASAIVAGNTIASQTGTAVSAPETPTGQVQGALSEEIAPAALPIPQGSLQPLSPDSPEGRMLAAINRARTTGIMCAGEARRAKTLQENSVLTHIAKQRAKTVGDIRTPQNNTGKPSLGSVLTANGYAWAILSENVTQGQPSPTIAFEAMLRDAAQCQSLMNDTYTEIGVGYSADFFSWVIIMARPKSSPLELDKF